VNNLKIAFWDMDTSFHRRQYYVNIPKRTEPNVQLTMNS